MNFIMLLSLRFDPYETVKGRKYIFATELGDNSMEIFMDLVVTANKQAYNAMLKLLIFRLVCSSAECSF